MARKKAYDAAHEKWLKENRVYWLPIACDRHTEVLGYHCSTPYGVGLWKELDWKNWWIDGPAPHIFNPGGSYFHVTCKGTDQKSYRVRCWYAGGKYRGKNVRDIGVAMKRGKLHWIIRTGPQKKNTPPESSNSPAARQRTDSRIRT